MPASSPKPAAPLDGAGASARQSAAAMYSLLSVMFINTMGFGIVVPLLPFYGQSFHAQPWQIALIFSAYSLGAFFGEPFWGRLSDRIGRKPILMSTLMANCLCYGALAFAPNIYAAFIIRLLGGMAAGNNSVVQGYIADVTPEDLRAGRMAKLGAAYNIGFILGPFAGGILAKPSAGTLGFQIPLLAASALAACASLGIFLVVKESRVRGVARGPQKSRWEMMGFAVGHPVISRLILLTFVVGFAFTGIESVFGLWAQDRFHWGPRNVSWCFGIAGIVSAPTQFFVTGALSRRFGEATMLAVGMVGTVATMAMQPFSHGDWTTIALMAGTAMFSSVAFPNAGALMSRNVDADSQGQVMGLNNAAGAFARVAGPFTAGIVFAEVNVNGPFWIGAAIVAPAILLAISAGKRAARV
jgi:DHA1 family tetracycline resistance protein-like MFS transporter